jgi:hypothetical protein
MSIITRQQELERKVDDITEVLKIADKKKAKKEFKIPWGIRVAHRRKSKQGQRLALFLRNSHIGEFKWFEPKGGNAEIEEGISHEFDNSATYFIGKIPLMVFFEWRMTPAGGKTDKEAAETAGDTTSAQQTIIRAIKNEELVKFDGKKKKKLGGSMIWIILIVIVVIYFVIKWLGGG